MKIFRFMSLGEFQKYCNGETLTNNTNHKEKGQASNSIGFCFFNIADYKPEKILHSVTAIVNISICVIFETERKNVIRSKGRYSRMVESDNTDDKTLLVETRESFMAKEYCTTQYSNKTFKLLKYAVPDWFNENNWLWLEGQIETLQ